MNNLVHIIVPAVLSVVGLFMFARGFKSMRRFRMVKDIPRSTIRSIAMGLSEIHGRIKAKQTLESPISKVPCVYYKYEIQVYRSSKNGGRWVTVAENARGLPFYTEDETGQVLVDQQGAHYNLETNRVYKLKTGFLKGTSAVKEAFRDWDNGMPGRMQSREWSVEESGSGWSFSMGGSKRIKESYLADNDDVYVLGTAVRDENEPSKTKICKGESDAVFLLSDRSEVQLTKNLKLKTIGNFGIGGIMFTFGIVQMLRVANII